MKLRNALILAIGYIVGGIGLAIGQAIPWTLNSDGSLYTPNNVMIGGSLNLNSGHPSTSPCTGALVVGTSPNCVGIGGNVNASGTISGKPGPLVGTHHDGSTDDAATIQAIVNTIPSGGILDCGGVNYNYFLGAPANDAFLTLPHAIRVMNCHLTYGSATTTTDVIHFAPQTPGLDVDDLSFFNDVISPSAPSNVRRHLINIDLSDSTNQALRGAYFSLITEVSDATGYIDIGAVGDSIHYTPASTPNANGGIFSSTFGPRLQLWGCINLNKGGDSITISGNQIAPRSAGDTQCAINAGLIVGAGNLVISNNNISSNGGITLPSYGVNTLVFANEIEQANTSTETNNTQLDSSGVGGGSTDTLWVHDNQFQSVVSNTTLQLTNISGVVVGQSVTGTNIPAACTVATVGDTNHPWVTLSCLATGTIANGATIVINGTNFTTSAAAQIQANAIRINGNGAYVYSNRFGQFSATPEITIASGANNTVLGLGNYFAAAQTHISDSGTNTINVGIGINAIIGSTGHLNTAGPTPTVSACGTGTPTITGHDNSFTIVVGGGTVNACTVTFGTVFATAPNCTFLTNNSGVFQEYISAVSASTVTFGSADNIAGETLYGICLP